MKVSVLIGSRNRPHVLARCLESIIVQNYPNLEIIVLDDSSDDTSSYDSMLKAYPRINLIHSDSPCGVAGGRNRLISEASGDILCFIDDDAYYEDNMAISRLVSTFQKDPRIKVVACKVIDHRPEKTDMLVPFSRRERRKDPELTQKPCYVSYYLGGCHGIHKDVIEHCGIYHDGLVFGEEELDLSYRVIAAGYRIYYEPSIVVHHVPQPSVVSTVLGRYGSHNELYFHIRNRFYLAYKYLPARYIPSYLFIWLSKYAIDAVRSKNVILFFKGIVDGVRALRGTKRKPICAEAVYYMSHNYGRLWY